jgi:hypothetical protein
MVCHICEYSEHVIESPSNPREDKGRQSPLRANKSDDCKPSDYLLAISIYNLILSS